MSANIPIEQKLDAFIYMTVNSTEDLTHQWKEILENLQSKEEINKALKKIQEHRNLPDNFAADLRRILLLRELQEYLENNKAITTLKNTQSAAASEKNQTTSSNDKDKLHKNYIISSRSLPENNNPNDSKTKPSTTTPDTDFFND